MMEEEQITASPGQEQQPEDQKALKRKKWLKRFGVAGFLFFLIKGLVWIAVALFAWKGCSA
jgi:hypothetical protein